MPWNSDLSGHRIPLCLHVSSGEHNPNSSNQITIPSRRGYYTFSSRKYHLVFKASFKVQTSLLSNLSIVFLSHELYSPGLCFLKCFLVSLGLLSSRDWIKYPLCATLFCYCLYFRLAFSLDEISLRTETLSLLPGLKPGT